jgi:pyruvate dehydrogenase E2 component (dihydrolipoamide acetyltransferase)
VPVIRNADQKNITQIAIEVKQLAEKARDRKLTLDDMSGGGISISNLGGIGGTYFTPIVNWPEVAILGVSRGADGDPPGRRIVRPRRCCRFSPVV